VPSPGSRRSACRLTATLLLLVAPLAVYAATQETRRQNRGPFTQTEITRAISTVKSDPNLATERTIKTLQWNSSPKESTPSSTTPWWLAWIANLFGWVNESARYLMWATVAVLVVVLVAYIVRLVGRMGVPAAGERFIAPTHVRDLDIRPETLPADIGAAARMLWDRGEHRGALALLYRGMLSRLAHVHRVPIRDSSTEGDCLALAANHLSETRRAYTSGLVRVWQRFVYGGENIESSAVYVLCDGFSAALDRAAVPPPLPSGGAA
jgi:hypothetical protein